MAILRYIPIALLMLSLTGCHEEFDPNVGTEPVLCLNSIITAGEPIELEVSHTWKFNDRSSNRDHLVKDAEVNIFANGRLVRPDYIPKEGDEIHISAESAKYGKAEATVIVPFAIPIEKVEFTPTVLNVWKGEETTMNGGIDFNLHVALSIKDNRQTEDYFKWQYNYSNPTIDDEPSDEWDNSLYRVTFRTGSFDAEAEPIFKEHVGVFESIMGDDDDSFMFFSDRQFSGKTYTLNLHFNGGSYSVSSPEYDESLFDCTVNFYLSTLSRSYYDRAIYVWQSNSGSIGDLGDVGFAEPIWAYSNVSTGAGIVAARSTVAYELDLSEFLKSTFNNQIK